MSLAITLSQKSYVGNGATTIFPTTFAFKAAADLVVEVAPSGGSFVTKVRGVDYYVVADGAEEPGSQVVFSVAPVALAVVRITRLTPRVQPVDLPPAGAFLPETHEAEFDRLTMMIQEQERRIEALEAAGGVGVTLQSQIVYSGATPADPIESNFPIIVACLGTPVGVALVGVTNITNPGLVRVGDGFDWGLPAVNQFSILHVGGLEIGNEYDFKLLVIYS